MLTLAVDACFALKLGEFFSQPIPSLITGARAWLGEASSASTAVFDDVDGALYLADALLAGVPTLIERWSALRGGGGARAATFVNRRRRC